ncbi:MAG TPA: hypothetical protein DCE78_05410, partial [Bacteroidetes bacterium]|nr:hypothetical protein [Bacteroidota bacterium]
INPVQLFVAFSVIWQESWLKKPDISILRLISPKGMSLFYFKNQIKSAPFEYLRLPISNDQLAINSFSAFSFISLIKIIS